MPADRPNFQIPHAERELNKEQRFQLAISGGITEALYVIDRSFETTSLIENRLAYHTRPHTEGVISRTGTILRAIQQANSATNLVTDRDVALGEFAAAWHDTVQHWQPNNVPDAQGQEMRKRKRALGDNERDSADLAVAYMKAANKQLGNVFSRRDMKVVEEAIMLTVPNFDVALGTVTQPNFAKYKGNLVAQAVALGDLGGGGMEGFPTARWESDALFVEDNLDFEAYRRTYQEADRERRLSSVREPDREQLYQARMIGWLESQIRFSKGRQGQLQQEIASMDTRVQEPVRQLFSHYDEALTAVQSFVNQRRSMDFGTWMSDLQNNLQNPPSYK
ncbi:MAG TPA: hypothetical protein VFQ63_00075 [Patescibacteria group bacterium]|nr:hypothetical protein [Patescibacteria group bacterium]